MHLGTDLLAVEQQGSICQVHNDLRDVLHLGEKLPYGQMLVFLIVGGIEERH